MGLFSKKEANRIIEFTDRNDTLFRLIDCTEYGNDTELIVSETHFAFIVADGVMSDIIPAGRHKIFEKGGFLNLQRSHRSVKVIFISKTAKVGIKWGTPPHMRIKYTDPKIGMPIDVGAFGTMEFQVAEPKQFYQEIIASFGETYSLSDLQERIRLKSVDKVAGAVRRMIQEKELSYYDFDTYKDSLQYDLLDDLKDVFNGYVGLRVCDFIIENLNITEDNEKKILARYQKAQDQRDYEEDRAINRRREEDRRDDARSQRDWSIEQDNWKKEDIERNLRFQRSISDQEDFLYNKSKEREREQIEYDRKMAIEDEERRHRLKMEEAAREQQLALAALRYDAVKSAGWEGTQKPADVPQATAQATTPGRFCRVCGNAYGPADMFCPGCGTPTDNNNQEIACPSCQRKTSVKNAFCPFCGAKMKP